jgi:hypothetical protein
MRAEQIVNIEIGVGEVAHLVDTSVHNRQHYLQQ